MLLVLPSHAPRGCSLSDGKMRLQLLQNHRPTVRMTLRLRLHLGHGGTPNTPRRFRLLILLTRNSPASWRPAFCAPVQDDTPKRRSSLGSPANAAPESHSSGVRSRRSLTCRVRFRLPVVAYAQLRIVVLRPNCRTCSSLLSHLQRVRGGVNVVFGNDPVWILSCLDTAAVLRTGERTVLVWADDPLCAVPPDHLHYKGRLGA